jgi:membrane protein implicated in regulation of membrane protease activity
VTQDMEVNMFDGLFVVNDWLDAILLGGFFFGLAFTALSLIVGAIDIGGPHVHVGHGNGGHGHPAHGHDTNVSIFNVATILAFLTWFGGCAYLIRNGAGLHVVLSLIGGLVAGVVGGYFVLRLLNWIKGQETFMDARYETLEGSMGRVTSPIRAGGVGEIVYEMNGVRQVSAARAPIGIAIPRGANVIVLRRERGIAMVEPWDELPAGDEWERRFALEAAATEQSPPP